MAIALGEPDGPRCSAVLETESDILISAATLMEALIVAHGRGIEKRMERLLAGLGLTVVEVTEAAAIAAAAAHVRWGRGHHPAKLNYGDCFAYEVAARHGCALLYVGEDFAKTDLASAL